MWMKHHWLHDFLQTRLAAVGARCTSYIAALQRAEEQQARDADEAAALRRAVAHMRSELEKARSPMLAFRARHADLHCILSWPLLNRPFRAEMHACFSKTSAASSIEWLAR